jgi:hypothetical protein
MYLESPLIKLERNVFGYLCLLLIGLQESGMKLITADDLDDAAEKAVKAYK